MLERAVCFCSHLWKEVEWFMAVCVRLCVCDVHVAASKRQREGQGNRQKMQNDRRKQMPAFPYWKKVTTAVSKSSLKVISLQMRTVVNICLFVYSWPLLFTCIPHVWVNPWFFQMHQKHISDWLCLGEVLLQKMTSLSLSWLTAALVYHIHNNGGNRGGWGWRGQVIAAYNRLMTDSGH